MSYMCVCVCVCAYLKNTSVAHGCTIDGSFNFIRFLGFYVRIMCTHVLSNPP